MELSSTRLAGLALAASALGAAGCASNKPGHDAPPPVGQRVIVDVRATQGNDAYGEIFLTQQKDGVLVEGRIAGLKPSSVHGFHVHQNPACGVDGMAAGGHFNPAGTPHGLPSAAVHHAGDLGAITANAAGVAKVKMMAYGVTLLPAVPTSVLDRSVIVHRDGDDGGQPTGNAGPRIACGIISAPADLR